MIKEKIQDLLTLFKSNPMMTQRMTECVKCPHLQKPKMKCAKCGCHLKLKMRFKSEHCPIGKW